MIKKMLIPVLMVFLFSTLYSFLTFAPSAHYVSFGSLIDFMGSFDAVFDLNFYGFGSEFAGNNFLGDIVAFFGKGLDLIVYTGKLTINVIYFVMQLLDFLIRTPFNFNPGDFNNGGGRW